jgi:hypothetical protein
MGEKVAVTYKDGCLNGMLCLVVQYIPTDVSEVITASVIRAMCHGISDWKKRFMSAILNTASNRMAKPTQ